MRIREIELRRYGHFDGHRVDLGDGRPDFHLIVGPNEAGKTTLLSAIGDLLFGIPDRTKLGFRHGMPELELAAWLQHAGEDFRFLRRKKRKDPITDLEGNAIGDATLVRFLHGIDRPSFSSMFGLSYDSLSKGGRSILENRDDGSRVVLEAEAGLSGLGDLIKSLDTRADDIFVVQGRTRKLNTRLRELEDGHRRVRDGTVEERTWSTLRERRKELEGERTITMSRLRAIASELAALERVRRTATQLATLGAYRQELADLEDMPPLPADAGERRAQAEFAIATKTAKREPTAALLLKTNEQISSYNVRAEVLAAEGEITALAAERLLQVGRRDKRPVIERQILDLEGEIAATRQSAAIAGDVPPELVRERLRHAAAQCRDQAEKIQQHERHQAKLRGELQYREKALGKLPSIDNLEPIKALFEAAPRRVAHVEAEAERFEREARERRDEAIAALQPWSGDEKALANLTVPTIDQLRSTEAELARLAGEREVASGRAKEAQAAANEADGERKALTATGVELPTDEALAEARHARDTRWQNVQARLLGERRDTKADASAAAAYEVAVARADDMADRRHTQADRLATYKALSDAVDKHEAAYRAHTDASTRAEGALRAVTADWASTCTALGFPTSVPPARVILWLTERRAALDAAKRHEQVSAELGKLRSQNASHIAALRHQLAAAGIDCPVTLPPDGVLARASAVVADLTTARAERKSVSDAIERLATDCIGADAELEVMTAEADKRAQTRQAALLAAGLAADSDDIAVDAALDAFDDLDELHRRLHQCQSELEALDGAMESYQQRVGVVLRAVGARPGADFSADVQQLATLLAEAQQQHVQRQAAEARATDLNRQLAEEDNAIETARAEINALCGLAEVSDPADLPAFIAKCDRRRELEALRQGVETSILAAGDGLDLAALQAEATDREPQAVIEAIATLKEEQEELNARRENLRLELEQALAEERTMSVGADASLALQDAEEAGAEAAALAEEFVATKATAAVLRWALAKHRQTRAAPLLQRASHLMGDITDGSISVLELDDFDDDGKPIIVGRRAGGEKVAVEDMSEGTRDQLYLSLRLASLEDRLAAHAMPFVCDDLLINCDDHRAALIIKALHAISKRTQVLCFTHHQHLREVVASAVGLDEVKLHELNPVVSSQVQGLAEQPS